MTTFQRAATEYLTSITPTHTPATMRTYERNFSMVLTPHFGADTELAAITSGDLEAFLTAEALLTKPNGQPRAQPTINQITGLLRSFLRDAATRGLTGALALPERARRPVLRLCDRCRGPLTTPIQSVPPPSASAPAASPAPEPAPSPAKPRTKAKRTTTGKAAKRTNALAAKGKKVKRA